MNFKISGRDLGMVVIGIGICAIASYKKFITLQRSNKDLSKKNDELVEDLEKRNIELDDCKKMVIDLDAENQSLRERNNVNATSIAS